ncbi:TRAP transporter small permease (plasmid) [Peteryoungia desertarenae]|uniref:TRAP transporter small permease protein n=1 Tax=Peteryoungia desertarenae TaxID=1813451 RepID=A0ABX6QTC7_9HYPH|nr:TRAP transporter small permease [Peteryoungia desertarenae]QLF71551.1 TRAP transporter small permease [Peteryoungia desertarenae]
MFKRLAALELLVSAFILPSIVVLVFVAAIMRSFGYPLIWSMDLAQLLFIWLCFLGATRAMREKAHIGIDLAVRWLKPRSRLKLEFAISLIILVFLAFLMIEGCRLTILNTERRFGDSGLSYAWVTAAVPLGCLMIAAALLKNMVEAWRQRPDVGSFVYSRIEFEPPVERDA